MRTTISKYWYRILTGMPETVGEVYNDDRMVARFSGSSSAEVRKVTTGRLWWLRKLEDEANRVAMEPELALAAA